MTLTEYLNQKEPLRMPVVILDHGEYSIGCSNGLKGINEVTQVFIQSPEFIAAFPGMTNEYVIKGNGLILYTQDGEGNPKHSSCFRLPEMPVKYGDHNPFDTEANLEWAIYCQNNNHNPNEPIRVKPINPSL